MSIKLRSGHRVFIYFKYVDILSGFERLSSIVLEQMKGNLGDGDLYVFLGKNRKPLNSICFDWTGLLLIAKRLNQSRFMQLEKIEDFPLTHDELDTLIRGSVIRRIKSGEDALTRRSENCTFMRDSTDRA